MVGASPLKFTTGATTGRLITLEDKSQTLLNSTATGVQTFLTTPSSANFASMITDETGTAGSVVLSISPTITTPTIDTTLTMQDAANIVLQTTTGTKIGTNVNQKLGFFNATPISQPSGDVVTALRDLGLIASGATVALADSATNAVNVANANNTTNATMYPLFSATQGGNYAALSNSSFTFNPSTGMFSTTGLTATTITAGGSAFSVGSDGAVTGKSFTASKASGVASNLALYEANSTDTDSAGFTGPASLTSNTSYSGQFPNARPTSSNMVLAWSSTASSGDGTPATPYVHAMSFVDLDNYLALAGGTMTGAITTLASAAVAGAGFNIPHGVAPNSPVNGDIWTTTAGVYARINGGTVGPFGSSSADVTGGSASGTGEIAAYGDTTGKLIGRSYVSFTGPANSVKAKTLSNAADTIAELGQTNNFTAAQTISKVNAAGGSADALTLSGTLGIMDGSDTVRGIYLNYTNANHTGTGNTVALVDVPAITGDANSNFYGIRFGNFTGTSGAAGEVERAISIGTGFDHGIYNKSIFYTGDDTNGISISAAGVMTFAGTATLTAPTITTSITPAANDGAALGSASLMWSDLFLAAGGVINWNNGNATLTHSTGLITSNVPLSVGTSNAITAGSYEVGAAADTTITRVSAGVIAVEGSTILAGTTPAIGAATGTSLIVTGRLDGTVGMTLSTADSATTISSTNNSCSYYMNQGDSDAHSVYTLPTAAAGLQYCVRNYTGISRVVKFQTSASGQYIDLDGTNTASGKAVKSGGAAGDAGCVIGVDATHWIFYTNKGTWAIDNT